MTGLDQATSSRLAVVPTWATRLIQALLWASLLMIRWLLLSPRIKQHRWEVLRLRECIITTRGIQRIDTMLALWHLYPLSSSFLVPLQDILRLFQHFVLVCVSFDVITFFVIWFFWLWAGEEIAHVDQAAHLRRHIWILWVLLGLLLGLEVLDKAIEVCVLQVALVVLSIVLVAFLHLCMSVLSIGCLSRGVGILFDFLLWLWGHLLRLGDFTCAVSWLLESVLEDAWLLQSSQLLVSICVILDTSGRLVMLQERSVWVLVVSSHPCCVCHCQGAAMMALNHLIEHMRWEGAVIKHEHFKVFLHTLMGLSLRHLSLVVDIWILRLRLEDEALSLR